MHTPGPWEAGKWGTTVFSPEGVRLASLGADTRTLGQRVANARLMAAAPDLLAACRAYLDRHNWQGDGTPWSHLTDQIKAAVARAEGDAP